MTDPPPAPAPAEKPGYTALARRYRPQRFDDFVGQENPIRALKQAIEQNRVAHAYLFTGARGVGKTSMARMFARALNCERGPSADPCGTCDICQAIAAGQDVDVLEIDGASNNKVDEIRELRQAVGYRPVRARYKIYIIDEVHMVTTAAFNALLKTLEEPPAHVKFIFATTEVQKLPVTILSRCQRFDFGGIAAEKIAAKLAEIVALEGRAAEPEALELVARRAAGSMRDSQSLLDQLLAYATGPLTADDVHRSLGTANEERVRGLAAAMFAGDAAAALRMVDTAAADGTQLGEWLEQALDYFRDLMALSVDPAAPLVSMPNRLRAAMAAEAKGRPVERILEYMDVLAACRQRMARSTFGRTLLEMAVVRCCRLEQFLALADQLPLGPAAPAGMAAAAPAPLAAPVPPTGAAATRFAPPAPSMPRATTAPAPSPAAAPAPRGPLFAEPLGAENFGEFWALFLARLPDTVLQMMLRGATRAWLAAPGEARVEFKPELHDSCSSYAEQNAAKVDQTCRELLGKSLSFRYERGAGPAVAAPAAESPAQLAREAERDPFVRRALEVFQGRLLEVHRVRPAAAAADAGPEIEPEPDQGMADAEATEES